MAEGKPLEPLAILPGARFQVSARSRARGRGRTQGT